MSKIGRNQPCPCGSGLKYKRCCEAKADEAARQRAGASAAVEQLRTEERQPRGLSLPPEQWLPEDDELDTLSHSVVGLIKEKRFDEALAVCERLRVEYPDVHDWLERSAMVHEARGDVSLALDFYRRHVAFITAPERRAGYDEELIGIFQDKVTALERRLATSALPPSS